MSFDKLRTLNHNFEIKNFLKISILRCRESNPGCLGENQKCYRLHHSGSLFFIIFGKCPLNI